MVIEVVCKIQVEMSNADDHRYCQKSPYVLHFSANDNEQPSEICDQGKTKLIKHEMVKDEQQCLTMWDKVCQSSTSH